jgi:uncharacterized protein
VACWEPTEKVVVPSAQQAWEALSFVHFAYDADVIADLLPEPLTPDLHDGRAWVGITPFRLHAAVLPAAPGPRSTYVEVNVRTYVRHPDGRDAVWFLSLELNQPAVVASLRALAGLPYRWSDTSIDEQASEVRYRVRRRRPHRTGTLEMGVAVGGPLATPPGALETFLVGRWRAFTLRAGRLLCVAVEHEPWPLRTAELTDWRSESFLDSLGLPEPTGEAHVLFSPGVDVRLGLPRTI